MPAMSVIPWHSLTLRDLAPRHCFNPLIFVPLCKFTKLGPKSARSDRSHERHFPSIQQAVRP